MKIEIRDFLNSAAIQLRKRFDVDQFSIVDVFAIVENLETNTLVFYPFSERISGMCVKIGEQSLIAINSTQNLGRQRFTVAHELYHLFIQKEFSNAICESALNTSKPIEEIYADTFASYFLVPSAALRSFIVGENLGLKLFDQKFIIKIEQHFQISHKALLVRLQNDGYITRAQATEFEPNVKYNAAKNGFRTILYDIPECNSEPSTNGAYIKMVNELFDKQLISAGKHEELLLDGFRTDLINLSPELQNSIHE